MVAFEGHTIKEVNGIRLEEGVGHLKDRPHVRRDGLRPEGQPIDQIVHVVEQIYMSPNR